MTPAEAATILKRMANKGPSGWAGPIDTPEALNMGTAALLKLQRVRDWIVFNANAEGGIVDEINVALIGYTDEEAGHDPR